MSMSIEITVKFIGNISQLKEIEAAGRDILVNGYAKDEYDTIKYSDFFGALYAWYGGNIGFACETDKDGKLINIDTCRIFRILYYGSNRVGFVGPQFVDDLLAKWSGRAECFIQAEMHAYLSVYEDGKLKRSTDFVYDFDPEHKEENLDADKWFSEDRDQYVIAELPPEPEPKHMQLVMKSHSN